MIYIYGLICIVIGAIPALLIYRKDRKRKFPFRWLPALLRFISFLLIAALILFPRLPLTQIVEQRPILIWLQDASTSVGNALGADTAAYRQQVKKMLAGFGDQYQIVFKQFGSQLSAEEDFRFSERTTNIDAAMTAVTEQYGGGNLAAVILASDGVFNEGSNPLYRRSSVQTPVYTVGIGDSTVPKDIAITNVLVNKTVLRGNPFEILVDVQARKLKGVVTDIILKKGDRIIKQSRVAIHANDFSYSIPFNYTEAKAGVHRFSVEITAAAGETNLENNKRDIFVEVIDRKMKILIAAAAPHPDIGAIRSALRAHPQYQVSVRYNPTLEDLEQCDMLIAHQWPGKPLATAMGNQVATLPVWVVAGSAADPSAWAEILPELASARPSGVAPRPELAPGFSLFGLPRNASSVIAEMPPLISGISGTHPADVGVLLADRRDSAPMWYFEKKGVPAAVLTGTGVWRWRLYEYKMHQRHEVIDEMIRQTVVFLTSGNHKKTLRVFTENPVVDDQQPVTVFAEFRNANGELVNDPRVVLTLRDSSGHSSRDTFTRQGNRYQLNLGLLAPGAYRYEGTVSFDGRHYSSGGGFRVKAVSVELLRQYSDYGMLMQLAAQTGGAFVTWHQLKQLNQKIKQNSAIRPLLIEKTDFRPLIDRWWWFVIIFVLLASEWIFRKYWNL